MTFDEKEIVERTLVFFDRVQQSGTHIEEFEGGNSGEESDSSEEPTPALQNQVSFSLKLGQHKLASAQPQQQQEHTTTKSILKMDSKTTRKKHEPTQKNPKRGVHIAA